MTVGAQIWVLTWTQVPTPDQRVARIYLLQNSWINYAELEFFVSSTEDFFQQKKEQGIFLEISQSWKQKINQLVIIQPNRIFPNDMGNSTLYFG